MTQILENITVATAVEAAVINEAERLVADQQALGELALQHGIPDLTDLERTAVAGLAFERPYDSDDEADLRADIILTPVYNDWGRHVPERQLGLYGIFKALRGEANPLPDIDPAVAA